MRELEPWAKRAMFIPIALLVAGVTTLFVSTLVPDPDKDIIERLDRIEQRLSTPSTPSAAPAPRPTPSVASRSRAAPPGRVLSVTPNWHALALCESGDEPRAVSSSGRYRGLYQFDLQTWISVGGRGDPAAASRAEQTHRAVLLFNSRGASPWPVCGRRLWSPTSTASSRR